MERVGVVDRLGDLGAVAGHAGQVEVEMGDMTTATASEVDEALAPFAVVIGGIDKISKSVDLIGLLRRRSMQEVEEAGQRRLMDELDRVMVASKRNARLVRAELDRVAADNARLPPGSTIALIRRNLLNTQARHFREAIAEFQHAADSFRDALKQRVTRQARIIMEDVTDDQVEQMVESGQIYETMARLHDRTVDAVVEIEERHKGILAIEQGVRELQDLFGEMAYLVDLQGETLDVIERNVRDAKSYVAKAEKNLIKTEKHARNARGRQCCILLIVVLVCAAIVAVLTFPDIFGTPSRSRGGKHARLAAPAAAAADGVLSATLPAGHRWVVK